MVQMHYHRNGRAEKDRTRIGLYFAKEPKTLKTLQILVVPGLVSPTDEYKPFGVITSRKVRVCGSRASRDRTRLHDPLGAATHAHARKIGEGNDDPTGWQRAGSRAHP